MTSGRDNFRELDWIHVVEMLTHEVEGARLISYSQALTGGVETFQQ